MRKFLTSLLRGLVITFLGLMLSVLPVINVKADSVSSTSSTPSPSPLPTVQVDGIVWDEAIYKTTVYATGQFSFARPAYSPIGLNQVTRSNLLAFDITTGQLDTTFVHSLDGAGRSISVSLDSLNHPHLYVGGTFNRADGQPRGGLAVFNLASNKLSNGVTDIRTANGVRGTVKAMAATSGGVFFGGNFAIVDGQSRANLAAYTLNPSTDTITLNNTWKPGVSLSNGQSPMVWAILPLSNKVIVGGSFDRLNGITYYGMAAVDRWSAAPLPWASQSSTYPIRFFTKDGAATSLTTDNKYIYVTGLVYRSSTGQVGGTMEGRAAITLSNGSLYWINGCYGDTYDAAPINGILYSVGHAHNCTEVGTFAETNTPRHVLAESTCQVGQNVEPVPYKDYGDFAGLPKSQQLNWYPNLNIGNISGQYQAAWAITGGNGYIVLGGEFTKADGVWQEGLVRYDISSISYTCPL